MTKLDCIPLWMIITAVIMLFLMFLSPVIILIYGIILKGG